MRTCRERTRRDPLSDSHRDIVAATRDGYQRWAASYDATENPVVALDDRVLPARYGDLEGRPVLDAACGTGRHTARLHAAGARVTALDLSPAMLARARERTPGPRYLTADLTQPIPLVDAEIDLVVCALVGEHLPTLGPTFAELHRVTRPAGRLLFSVYDPSLAVAGKAANFPDPATGEEVRLPAVDHLTSDYWRAAREAGWEVEDLRQYRADEELATAVPKAARYLGQPLLLVLEARA
jgi:SAM-dependent methyltransferase